jgi:alpha-1,6-mannosyltransferase
VDVTTLHLTNAYHPTSGGIRTFYTALIEAANQAKRRVVLVVPGEQTETVDVGRYGRIYRLRAPLAPAFDRRYRLLLPHRYLPFTGGDIVDVLRRERPDLVEICDKYSLPYLAALLRKHWHRGLARPALVGLSCERFDDNMSAYVSPSDGCRRFTRWYIRHIYGPPFDVHIANSEYTAGELRQSLHDRPAGFIRVVPMGVDTTSFGSHRRCLKTRHTLLARAGGSPDSVLLFYAGRLSPEKNVGLLLETLRALVRGGDADYRLVLAGDGPCVDWIRRQRGADLDGRVLLCGNLDRDALATACASSDVFVHPNPREPFGIGPLEAMASGIPVVVPNAGGVLAYASDRNAWLAPPLAVAFRDAVRAARRGDPQRIACALATARAFRWSEIASRYFQVYDDICAGLRAYPLSAAMCMVRQ